MTGDNLTDLVAAEFDRHRACLRKQLALDIAQALEALEPPADDPDARGFRRGVAAAARAVLHHAGIPADTPVEVRP